MFGEAQYCCLQIIFRDRLLPARLAAMTAE
jgi:hypothetical protein